MEVHLVVGGTAWPPIWPDPTVPAAVPGLAPAAVSSQPEGQSRAGPLSLCPGSHPLIHHTFPGTLLGARGGEMNKYRSCPEVPQEFISLWLPRTAVGMQGRPFQSSLWV